MITITLINEDGNESTRELNDGAKLSEVVPSGKIAVLNDKAINRNHKEVELRDGDVVEIVRRSGKAA